MNELVTGVSVPAIAAAVYCAVELIKYTTKYNEKVKTFIPLISAVLGLAFGLVCFFFVPNVMPTANGVVAAVLGVASGLTATGFNQIIKQVRK